ncbi:MAG: HAMP domain-containing histidine kinase [Alphaproteobacteria bacterium]|nr:HAMP domain-containing histidine kinase [Alphaproteobacteria bacterium]HPF45535.1 HAMP domain-containing sensor histidine kinase [Emcibacteraceae bacterium]
MTLNEAQKTKTGRRRSLWVRLVTISVIWTALALVLGGYLLSLVFRDTLEQNFDERLNSLLENLIGISSDDTSATVNLSRPMVDPRFEQPYSGWYWQIAPKGFSPVRSRSLWDVSLDVNFNQTVNRTRYRFTKGPEEQQLRLVERDVTLPGSDLIYRFAVAIDTSEIDEQADRFDKILLVGLGALGAGLIAASLLQVFLGLRPLGHIKESLSKVRNGEEEYLPKDFPSEIQPLADELNALLDHNNEIVERSRTQVGNLAHALKTPIAVLRNEARMNDGPMSETVAKQTENMHKYVEHYLKRARMAANVKTISSHSQIMPSIHNIARALNKVHPDKNIIVKTEMEEKRLVFKGDLNDFEEMVGNIMENAAKWARRNITVECFKEGQNIKIEIRDDGPGIDIKAREAVFARGGRLDEKIPGTGLGLSIVKDLADLYGGKIILDENKQSDTGSGLLATLILPSV